MAQSSLLSLYSGDPWFSEKGTVSLATGAKIKKN